MDDIVEQLRRGCTDDEGKDNDMMDAAADEIEQLRKEVDAWRARYPLIGFDGHCLVIAG